MLPIAKLLWLPVIQTPSVLETFELLLCFYCDPMLSACLILCVCDFYIYFCNSFLLSFFYFFLPCV